MRQNLKFIDGIIGTYQNRKTGDSFFKKSDSFFKKSDSFFKKSDSFLKKVVSNFLKNDSFFLKNDSFPKKKRFFSKKSDSFCQNLFLQKRRNKFFRFLFFDSFFWLLKDSQFVKNRILIKNQILN